MRNQTRVIFLEIHVHFVPVIVPDNECPVNECPDNGDRVYHEEFEIF